MKDNEKNMKTLSVEDMEMVSGGIDDTTVAVLELIGKIVDWFNS